MLLHHQSSYTKKHPDGIVEDHKKSTGTTYGTRTSTRVKRCHENKADSADKENENTELKNVSEAVNKVSHIPSVCWCQNSYILLEIYKTILETNCWQKCEFLMVHLFQLEKSDI